MFSSSTLRFTETTVGPVWVTYFHFGDTEEDPSKYFKQKKHKY